MIYLNEYFKNQNTRLLIYDIEKDGWRSMRYENVIGFKFLGALTTDMEHPSSFKASE